MSIKYVKNANKGIKTGKTKYILRKLIAALIIFMEMVLLSCRPAYATMTNGVPDYKAVGYDYEMCYYTYGYFRNSGTYGLGGDISKMDTVKLPHNICYIPCCDNPSVESNGSEFKLVINGVTVYRNTTFVKGSRENTDYIYPEIDIRPYRKANSTYDYSFVVKKSTCTNCGGTIDPTFIFNSVYFYDKRGTAEMPDTINTEPGETITVCPTYGAYADHTVWGIKYAGDVSFTSLSDGKKSNGMEVSGAKNGYLTITKVPEGEFDLGVFVYDADNQLPFGTEYPNTPYSVHVSSHDKTPPQVSVTKTDDIKNRAVILTINANDTGGLHSQPYSFDDGTTYGNSEKKSITSPGTYMIAVRDKSGNVTKTSVTVSEEELLKLMPTPTPTPKPTATPTPKPTATPTPTPKPTATPTPKPTKSDTTPPDIKVKKILDKDKGVVTVELLCTDDAGLHNTPYSWDGGVNYSADNTKDFNVAGKYYVAARDKALNVKKGSFYIDSIEIEKVKKNNNEEETKVVDQNPTTGNGGEDTKGNDQKTSTTPSSSTSKKQKDEFSEERKEKEEYVIEGKKAGSTSSTVKIKGLDTEEKSDKKDLLKKDSDMSPSAVSDADSNEMFQRIKENSDEYIISMREKSAAAGSGPNDEKTLKGEISLDEAGGGLDYSLSGEESLDAYTPKKNGISSAMWVLLALGIILFILLLAFVLFFGVIILAEKETEYTKLSNMEAIKLPVAICLVTYSNGHFKVCVRDLLSKYGVVYAKFGPLFTYIFENEEIKIQTKFKGEEGRIIATERIRGELIIGNKGGKKK